MENKKTNSFALAGFICSFFVPLLGLIFSIIGLNKVKECNDGKGFSIAGIIISAVKMVLGFILVILFFIFGLSFTASLPSVIEEIDTRINETAEIDDTSSLDYDEMIEYQE